MKSFFLAAFVGVSSARNLPTYTNYLAAFGKNINSVEEFSNSIENFHTTDAYIT